MLIQKINRYGLRLRSFGTINKQVNTNTTGQHELPPLNSLLCRFHPDSPRSYLHLAVRDHSPIWENPDLGSVLVVQDPYHVLANSSPAPVWVVPYPDLVQANSSTQSHSRNWSSNHFYFFKGKTILIFSHKLKIEKSHFHFFFHFFSLSLMAHGSGTTQKGSNFGFS